MTTPIELVVKRYQCPHCRRSRSSKAATVAHMGRCWHNPDVRSCKTCVHFVLYEAEPEVGLAGQLVCERGVDLMPDGTNDTVDFPRVHCDLWAVAT